MTTEIERERANIERVTGRRVMVSVGNSTTGISWALLDDDGYVLLKAKTRKQFAEKLDAFRMGCHFTGVTE